MIFNVYSIHDSKVSAYHRPFFASCHAEAVRIISQTSRDEKSQFFHYPSDFTLFFIGQYDDSSGKMLPSDVFESLGNIIQVVSRDSTSKNLQQELDSMRFDDVSGQLVPDNTVSEDV